MKVYLVMYGIGSDREVKKIFAYREDAELFVEGAEAAYASLGIDEWDVYDHDLRSTPTEGDTK